jgi:hypothetical protein
MFELRIHTGSDPVDGPSGARTVGTFTSYPAAVTALEANEAALQAQLAANGEGGTALVLRQVIVHIDGAQETGWAWSSYRPASPLRRR